MGLLVNRVKGDGRKAAKHYENKNNIPSTQDIGYPPYGILNIKREGWIIFAERRP